MSAGLLTPDVLRTICDAIIRGSFRSVARRLCGVSDRTWYRWLARGRKEAGTGSLYDQLATAVVQAEAQGETNAVARIIELGTDDPKHLQWWLSRKYPQRWGNDRLRVRELEARLRELEHRLNILPAAPDASQPGDDSEG